MKKKLTTLLLCLGLTACVVNREPAPADSFYQLGIGNPRMVDSTVFERIVIRPLRADSLRQERALLYSTDTDGLSLQRYNYHYWADAPPTMLATALRRYLQQSRIANEVVLSESGVRGDIELSGRLLHFEQLIGDGLPRSVKVALRLQVTRRSDGEALLLRDYEQLVAIDSGTMLSSNAAFSTAVTLIMSALVVDLENHVETHAGNR